MFKFFKRKKVIAANPLQEKAAGTLVAKILWLQSKWAGFMDRKVNRLSVRSKKFGLMIFVGLSVLICVSILIETFYRPASFSVHSIAVRKHSTSTGEIPVSSLIPSHQYTRIIVFHHYMDSLSVSVSGRKIYDSIVRCRPGLLDSAITLEKLYHQSK